MVRDLFPPLHGLLAHLQEAIFGFRVGEAADRLGCLVGVSLGKGSCLLEAVTS